MNNIYTENNLYFIGHISMPKRYNIQRIDEFAKVLIDVSLDILDKRITNITFSDVVDADEVRGDILQSVDDRPVQRVKLTGPSSIQLQDGVWA